MICRCTLEASTFSLALESATPPCKCFPPLHRHHRHHRHQHQHHYRDDLLHLLKSLLGLQSPSPCVHYSPNEPHSDFRFCFVSQFSGCSIDAVGGKRLIASSSLLGSEPRLCLCALRPCVCACVCACACVPVWAHSLQSLRGHVCSLRSDCVREALPRPNHNSLRALCMV